MKASNSLRQKTPLATLSLRPLPQSIHSESGSIIAGTCRIEVILHVDNFL
jgi:hypothetical protein